MDTLRASPFRRNAAVTLTAIRPQFNRPPCGYWLSSNFDECESPERIRLHIGSSSILSVRPRRIELELRILLHNIAVSTMLTSSRCVVAPESSSRVFNGFSSVEPSRTRDVRPFNLAFSGLERVASAVCQAPQIGSAMAKGCRCGHWEAEASARHFGHSAQGSRSTPA